MIVAEQKSLGDCAKVISGYAFKSKDFAGSGVPVVKIANIKHEHVSFENAQFLPEDFLTVPDRYHVRQGDVMISLTGSHVSQPNSVVGRVARYRHNSVALLNQRAARIVIHDPESLDQAFLYYFLRQKEVTYALALNASGAANQANISPTDVENIKLPLIPFTSQTRIAAILSAYDDLIENNRRRIALLEQAARLLYREWFVHFRFPGHETAKFVDGLPEGWVTTALGEKAQILKGRNITKETVNPGSVPVVAGGLKPAYFHDTANVKGPVVTISASGANAGHVAIYFEDIWASDCSYLSVTTNPNLFFIHQLLLDNVNRIRAMQKGAAQPHVYPKDLQRMEVTLPSSEIIDQFVQLLDPIYSQIQALDEQNAQLTKARDLLLPRLMDGRIPVEV